MNRSPLARVGTALVVAAALVTLAGCAGGAPAPSHSPTRTSAGTAAPPPSATPTTAPTVDADPACDTIIPPEVVSSFDETGWSFRQDVFRAGETEVPGGISCTWGDAEVASDHVQMFGWAPVSADDATQLESELLQQGWVREQGADGVYITEDPKNASAVDDDGYGWTYLFGDGWVKFADTKQGLLLVEWPPAG